MRRSLAEKFAERVSPDPNTGCLLWMGPYAPEGYGRLKVGGKMIGAHRVAWELKHGPIPDGLHVCHVCDNKPCVNDAHLFVGTRKDNAQDALKKGRLAHVFAAVAASNRRRGKEITHCLRGHEFDAENTYVTRGGMRSCRKCRADAQRESRTRRAR